MSNQESNGWSGKPPLAKNPDTARVPYGDGVVRPRVIGCAKCDTRWIAVEVRGTLIVTPMHNPGSPVSGPDTMIDLCEGINKSPVFFDLVPESMRKNIEAGRTDLEVPADDEPVAIVVESRQYDIDTVDLSIKPDDGYKFIDTPFDAQSLASSFALPPEVINSGEVGYNRAAIHASAVAWDPKAMAKNIGAGVLTDEERKKFAEQTKGYPDYRVSMTYGSVSPMLGPDKLWPTTLEYMIEIIRLAVDENTPVMLERVEAFAAFLQSQGAEAEAARLRQIATGSDADKYILLRNAEVSTGGIDRTKFGLPEETEPREVKVKVTIRNGQSLTVKIVADNPACVDISPRVAADDGFLSAVLAAGLNKYDIKEYQRTLGGWRVELNGAHSAFFLSTDGKLTELQ